MKYLLKILIILIILLFGLKLVIHLFDKGHSIEYTIGNFDIKETLTVNGLYNEDNYYFEISHEDFTLNFQITNDYHKAEKIITKIKYLDESGIRCVLPIFKNNQIITDIMCLENDVITYGSTLNNETVASFTKTIKEYDENNFTDNATSKKISNTVELYEDNLNPSHYVAMETYRGITLLNNLKTIKLFDNDVYKKPISVFTDKYYIVADYNEEYSFKKFYVVNLINGNLKEIRSYNEISFDSIIQGVVDDEIYLFDSDALIQYKINIDDEEVTQINDEIKYYNGDWTTMTTAQALAGTTFNEIKPNEDYVKIDKQGEKTGYYYLYKPNKNKYSVYRIDIQNNNIKTYLFETTDLNSIAYIDDYIYFKNDDTYYYYSNLGIRRIATNKELEFNQDILFGVYAR